MSEIATPRPASTILLLRDSAGPDGKGEIEVFMMVRHYQIDFNSGALVFPGGSVDAGDRDIIGHPELLSGGEGFDAAALSFRIVAIRETFEESGILLARPRGSTSLVEAARAHQIEAAHRAALCEGKIAFCRCSPTTGWCSGSMNSCPTRTGSRRRACRNVLTPGFSSPPRRRSRPVPMTARSSTDSIWLSPREALAGGESGRFKLPFPTTRNLIKLGRHAGVQAAFEDAKGKPIVTVMPIMTKLNGGRQLRIPREAGYDGEIFEVGAM